MSVLRTDPYARAAGRMRGRDRSASGGVTLFALMFASLALIVMSRLNHAWVQDMRGQMVEAMLPTLETVSAPAVRIQQWRRKIGAYVKVLSEIDRLEAQNEQLKRWEARANELEREIAKYRKLLNARDVRTFAFVTGRVVADGRGPFARSVILNIGRKQDVRNGYPVVNGDGLVGRTLNAGATASRVLLLTDPNSRVPVVFGERDARGVLAGNNTASPELLFVPQSARPAVGDTVRTSGHGGLFPPGLSVGKIAQVTPEIKVALLADMDKIDFVSVLLFGRPVVADYSVDAAAEARRTRKSVHAADQDVMVLPTRPGPTLRKNAAERATIRRRRKP